MVRRLVLRGSTTALACALFLPVGFSASAVVDFADDFSSPYLDHYDQSGAALPFTVVHNDPAYHSPTAKDYAFANDETTGRRLLIYNNNGSYDWRNYVVQYAVSHGDNDQFSLIFYYNNGDYYRVRFETNGNSDDLSRTFSKYSYFAILERITDGNHETPVPLRTSVWPATSIHHTQDGNSANGIDETILFFRVRVVTLEGAPVVGMKIEYLNPNLGSNCGGAGHPEVWSDLFGGEIIVDAGGSDRGSVGYSSRENGADLDPVFFPGFRAHQLVVSGVDPNDCIVNAGDDHREFADAAGFASVDLNQAGTFNEGACGADIGFEWYLNGADSPFSTSRNPQATPLPTGLNVITVKMYAGSTEVDSDSATMWIAGSHAFNLAVVPDPHVGQSDAGYCGQTDPETDRTKQFKGILRDIQEIDTNDDQRISAVLSMGDLAFRASEGNIEEAALILISTSNLDIEMPFITSTGNHDTDLFPISCEARSRPTPALDEDIYPIVTSALRGGIEEALADGDTRALHYRFSGVDWGNKDVSIVTLQTSPLPHELIWLDGIVADFPDDILILMTHHMFDEWGRIDGNFVPSYYQVFDDGISPQGLIDHIAANPNYKNLKMILSGHMGYGGGIFSKVVQVHGRKVLVLCTDISFAHLSEGADGQYRVLTVDLDNDWVFSRLRYARTHEHVAGYVVDVGRVDSCKHELSEFVVDLAEVFSDGFESGDASAWSSAHGP